MNTDRLTMTTTTVAIPSIEKINKFYVAIKCCNTEGVLKSTFSNKCHQINRFSLRKCIIRFWHSMTMLMFQFWHIETFINTRVTLMANIHRIPNFWNVNSLTVFSAVKSNFNLLLTIFHIYLLLFAITIIISKYATTNIWTIQLNHANFFLSIFID